MRGTDGAGGVDGGGGGPVVVSTNATSIQGVPVSNVGPSALDQVLRWNGLELVYAPDAAGADFTQTIWVDPGGNPASNGLSPGDPTTLAQALAEVAPGGIILAHAGTYPAQLMDTRCKLVGISGSETGIGASVQITGLLTITAANCQVVGVDLLGGFADTSAAAGTTMFVNCAIGAASGVVNAAAGQQLRLWRSGFVSMAWTGTNGGATALVDFGPASGSITNSTPGSLSLYLNQADIGTIGQTNASGSLTIVASSCPRIASIAPASGSVAACTLFACVIGTVSAPGTISTPGAAASTVKIVSTVFDRAGSSIPASAEGGVVSRSTALEFIPGVPANWGMSPPTTVAEGLDYLAGRGAFEPVTANRLTPLATSSSTPSVYLTTTDAYLGGIYFIMVFMRFSGSLGTTQMASDFILDGFNFGGPLVESGVPGGRFPFSGPATLALAPGNHTIDLTIYQAGGGGTTTAEFAEVTSRRFI